MTERGENGLLRLNRLRATLRRIQTPQQDTPREIISMQKYRLARDPQDALIVSFRLRMHNSDNNDPDPSAA